VPTGWLAKVEAGRAVVGSHGLAGRLARALGCGAYALLAGPDQAEYDRVPSASWGPDLGQAAPVAPWRPARHPAEAGPDALARVLDVIVTADLGLPLDEADAWSVPDGRRA